MAIIFLILAIVFFVQWRKALKARDAAKQDADKLQQSLTEAIDKNYAQEDRIKILSKYEGIVDIDAEIEKKKSIADAEIQSSQNAAAAELAAAKKDAADYRAKAKANYDAASKNAELKLSSADQEAKRIITDAETRAKEIAGEAYEMAGKAKQYEEAATAMRNVIEGYGDRYLKPTYSLLDDLAADFGHTEAGQKLQLARENSARMITAGTAATCDYVEQSRRSTAIAFVTDAFNGKVDSILSKIKKDNYGTLARKIKDAYELVNYNGRAFRNAVITPEYLAARLEELKWGVVVQELKAQAQEEQRRLREQIREEERARREYEKAMKDAAKEEEMLRKAMEKAQKQIETATEVKRAEYEAKMEELKQKLAEAEERGRRALSMAQQTKHGNVYIISNIGSFGENIYKVGMTRRLDPLDRVKELGDASVPYPFDVHAVIESDDAPSLETKLHKALSLMQVNKVNPRKEFFRVPLAEIKAMVEKMGCKTSWTMDAEAAEYRETLAIEESMKNDPDAKRRWEEYAESIAAASADNQDDN